MLAWLDDVRLTTLNIDWKISISGSEITESGILAAAHLAGPGSVKRYLRSLGKFNVKDGYGTTVSTYMKKFSGYDMSSVEANRKAKAVL